MLAERHGRPAEAEQAGELAIAHVVELGTQDCPSLDTSARQHPPHQIVHLHRLLRAETLRRKLERPVDVTKVGYQPLCQERAQDPVQVGAREPAGKGGRHGDQKGLEGRGRVDHGGPLVAASRCDRHPGRRCGRGPELRVGGPSICRHASGDGVVGGGAGAPRLEGWCPEARDSPLEEVVHHRSLPATGEGPADLPRDEVAPVLDVDRDGHDAEAAGGDDCDDSRQDVNPDEFDVCEDEVDQDCSGADRFCYYPAGVQQDVDPDDLVGWKLCWTGLYSGFESLADVVLAACDGDYLMLGCREVGGATIQLLAAGPRDDVTFDTGQNRQGTHEANGVSWYFDEDWSWGFLPEGDVVDRYSCDYEGVTPGTDVDPDLRMCWHTSGGNLSYGYRCGTDYPGSDHQRFVYHRN